ncbi:unnamed protein product [Lactuca saligna]|uniref:Uncharacterized protein n=1 Tax=Lactuca saligna TaxID=75948 RepID=A0AA35ZES0_LACSI|nr:unnamed protein product [Lactuca saligna]
MAHIPSPTLQYRQQVTRKGVVFLEVPTPVSPRSKKRCAKYMAKHISTKQKKHKKQMKLVLHENLTDDEVVPEMPINEPMGHNSPVTDSTVQSHFEETVNLGDNVAASIVETTINNGEQSKQSTPEQTLVIPPKVSNTKSFHEEVRTSNITANVSDMGANVNMGE